MMLFFRTTGRRKGLDETAASRGIAQQQSRLLRQLGPDTGFDSIGDYPQAGALAACGDRLEQEKALPKTIIYNNNPTDNYIRDDAG